ncbi:YgjP-like metallopeptidase domain-containing protein [Halobacillus sp. KGW1]|uniref:YgjP-like metallopeptidase domain-containing protein n=1 Tax=Halobacillus sp. KGW1 TaxID=1793726 RepID=UPI000780D886|nr:YgjP-like metallopeptidase domain-containing protein [Halobacillus sp. KGW1]
MQTIVYDDKEIHYDLHKKPDVPFIKIYMDDLNGVQVTASSNKDETRIRAFVEKKAGWIIDRWCGTHEDLYILDTIDFKEKEQRIPYLGRSYKLKIHPETDSTEASFAFRKGGFAFHFPQEWNEEKRQEAWREQTKAWFKQKAADKLASLAEETSVSIEEDHIRLGRKHKDGIQLNWRLVHRPKETTARTIQDLIEEKAY